MAIKTFTTGEVLTAADTNTYLANSGLVFVKSQTIGTAVSSVTVSDAFSATYDNYKIIVNGGISTTQNAVSLVLGASNIAYYGVYLHGTFSGSTAQSAGINNASSFTWAGGVDIAYINVNIELQNPFQAKYTAIQALTANYGTLRGHSVGEHEVSSSFSAFTLTPLSGTITGGTITVYGYRKA